MSQGASSKLTGHIESSDSGVFCNGLSNSSTESLLRPTRQMSVGIGECPIGSKTFTALTFTSESVELLESEAVDAVDSVKMSG